MCCSSIIVSILRINMGSGCVGFTAVTVGSSVKWQVLTVFVCLLAADLVVGQVRYSIPEEMLIGAFVGNIAQDLGIDAKRLKSGKARIVNGDSSRFIELNTDKGILAVKERIDREELCGQTTPCSFSFEVILENPMQLHSVTVEIIDVNDNAPSFPKKEIRLDIIESALPGARFLLDRAVDPDVGINGLQSYTLKPTDHFNLKLLSRPDGTKYAEMVLQSPLDREKQEEMSLLLTAVDGGDPKRSGTVKITVIVLDANDNTPVFSQAVYKASIHENAFKGTIVVTVSATDLDKGSYGEVTYYYAEMTDSVADFFQLNENNGEITLIGTLDYEKNKHYELDVQAKDHGGHTDSTKVIIEIIDVNDNSPLIALTSFSSPISEDSPIGTTVAIINVKDLDSGKNGKVHCSIDQDIPFSIKSSLRNYYNLLTDAPLDREMISQYNISITARDEGSPPLTSMKTLVLTVSDVNDNAPQFSRTVYTAHVTENNSPGVSIFTVHAGDADSTQNARITYLIEETAISVTPVSSYVSINSESGVMYAVRSFDYEHIKDLQVLVKAQDGGSPPLSSNVTVNIHIQDQNDNSPQILYPVQSGVSLVAEMVARSADVGYLVTKVVAVDADSGQNAWLSYKLLKATDRALFEVGSQNGEIRTSRQVSDKDAVKQRLVVVVEDNGQPSRSATVNVNVAVADSFPEVLSEFSDITHDKDYNDSLTFYLVLSLAVVSFLFIVSVIVLVSVKVYRWRQSRLFYKSNGNLPVIPSAYYPPRYADVGATGTIQHVYNYEVCMTTDSGNSEYRYIRPVSQNLVNVDPSGTETMPHGQKDNVMDETDPSIQQKPANTDWRFSQGQRPGPSGAPQRPEEAGPWPNPPTEAEQLQALMAAANEVSEATNTLGGSSTLGPGTMGLSTRYSPQFTLQHVPDYRQNIYIPGSTATLTGNNGQGQGPPQGQPQALPQPQPQQQPPQQPPAEAPKPAQTPANKKKSAKKDKK
ncbi:protocadherin gamma-A11 isoform X2 [Amia ocellicauda]|uniref:protocadherin gamma-A11 isoform X2 n=1 Tax=Amia ocellicauda TaxID=2972642 RepID=UPI003464699E